MLPKRVLIIDDEAVVRFTTGILLKKRGIEVFEASNGDVGLETARAKSPDVILLDITMPGMDGWSVLRSLKADKAAANARIILFSASDYDETLAAAKRMGAHAVLRKPFEMKELLEACEVEDPAR